MPVLPEEITGHEFRRRWRGYDRGQVAGFLHRVGVDYGGAIERIAAVAEDGARARAERAELDRRLDALTVSAHQAAEQIRADADADAAAVRARAEHAAVVVVRQAEEAAAACTRQARALRDEARADADAARHRLEDADLRARQLEDAARRRWDAVRAETEARFEQLQAAERRFADRVRRVETTLGALRDQVSLLDRVHQAERALAAVRADAGAMASDSADEHRDEPAGDGHQR